jgi:hypothetical protein
MVRPRRRHKLKNLSAKNPLSLEPNQAAACGRRVRGSEAVRRSNWPHRPHRNIESPKPLVSKIIVAKSQTLGSGLTTQAQRWRAGDARLATVTQPSHSLQRMVSRRRLLHTFCPH